MRNRLARAKRHYIPGYVWHITHLCDKCELRESPWPYKAVFGIEKDDVAGKTYGSGKNYILY